MDRCHRHGNFWDDFFELLLLLSLSSILPETNHLDIGGESGYVLGCLAQRELVCVTNWHFSCSFHFLFHDLMCIILFKSLSHQQDSHSLLSISPSYFFSDHQENRKQRSKRNQGTLQLQRTAHLQMHSDETTG